MQTLFIGDERDVDLGTAHKAAVNISIDSSDTNQIVNPELPNALQTSDIPEMSNNPETSNRQRYITNKVKFAIIY